MSDLIKITGLWINTSKQGDTYMAGYMGSARIIILPNNYKDLDNHPDYIMYIAQSKPDETKKVQSNGKL